MWGTQREIKWWQWLLIGTGLGVTAIITGPVADRLEHATFAGLIVAILAWTGCTVCWMIGIIRFAKWVWCKKGRLRLLLGLLSLVLLTIGVRHVVKERLHKKRELSYQTTLQLYEQAIKPGMTRKQVEDYLHARSQAFSQSCCVDIKEFRKHSWDDLVKIGAEDAPWFCSESAVYVAFQFSDSPLPHDEMWRADDLDTVKSVSVYHRPENCL
jgi:hypothetical protein